MKKEDFVKDTPTLAERVSKAAHVAKEIGDIEAQITPEAKKPFYQERQTIKFRGGHRVCNCVDAKQAAAAAEQLNMIFIEQQQLRIIDLRNALRQYIYEGGEA